MTECERIINEGVLPKSFFKEEVRDGYFVSSEMKKVWAIEIDLYLQFEKICKKHKLTFWTDGGTTLGAIRHKGFIPWDDDFDVCMPRESYNKLKKLNYEFKNQYFLQNPDTDEEYGFSFMRLCNSNTTVIIDAFIGTNFNKGICIDIFPIDKVTKEDFIPRRERIYNLIMRNSAFMRYNNPEKSVRDFEVIEKYYDNTMKPSKVWEMIEAIATLDEAKDTEYLSLIVSTQYAPQKKIWPKRIFSGYKLKTFESIEVRVPSGYDEQLSIYFGNYHEFPPTEQRGAWHNVKFLPDVPYFEYFNETKGE